MAFCSALVTGPDASCGREGPCVPWAPTGLSGSPGPAPGQQGAGTVPITPSQGLVFLPLPRVWGPWVGGAGSPVPRLHQLNLGARIWRQQG